MIANISKMDPDRKCFRMIGGVLVELQVKTVLPDVAANRDGVRLCVPVAYACVCVSVACFDCVRHCVRPLRARQ